jgi:hypothetical protein
VWLKNGFFAASHDALIGDDGRVEIKCIFSRKGEMVHSSKPKLKQFVSQIVANMRVTRRKWWLLLLYTTSSIRLYSLPEQPELRFSFVRSSLWQMM